MFTATENAIAAALATHSTPNEDLLAFAKYIADQIDTELCDDLDNLITAAKRVIVGLK